ncbi:MAG: hypothetical protein B7Z55_11270 [Planctomycetales bacterium 12-60-4]|nr:MAG: hypothetical protein B7Z55_11270 [Planctomycetales bacterium 12-60-4]
MSEKRPLRLVGSSAVPAIADADQIPTMRSTAMKLIFSLTACAAVIYAPLDDARAADSDRRPIEWLQQSKRVVFLGDSITFSGQYIAEVEAWMLTQGWKKVPTVIDVGLPSETVSGLSEDGHAGGQFPRPVLSERLQRVLAVTTPDLVFACYGMNCGIYLPFAEERFQKYQAGIGELKRQVEEAGAKLVLITPPYHDDLRAKRAFSYNEVLSRYSQWLLSQREAGWVVIDLNGPMTDEVAMRRKSLPEFTFQPDAVHPNAEGQWFIARQLITEFGDESAAKAESPEALLSGKGISPDLLKLVQQRMTLRRDAYLSAAGHKRPGVKAGLPVPEAEAKARELTMQIERSIQAGK